MAERKKDSLKREALGLDQFEPSLSVSIIVPMFNEAEVLPAFFERLFAVMRARSETFEIVCVDDGSTDETVPTIRAQQANYPEIVLVKLSRNFGKEIAMTAGLDRSRGEAVILIDADLQDPPELIPEFLDLWQQGYENVYGLRIARKEDSLAKRSSASLFYAVFNRLSKTSIPPNAGDFRLLGGQAKAALCACREKQRFMKGLYSWVGYKSIAVPYERPARFAGTTKFNARRLMSFALDGIIAHSNVLLKLTLFVGLIGILFAVLMGIWLLIDYFVSGQNPNGFYTTAMLILGFFAINFLMLGVIGEYIWRIYDETKDRPLYFIDESGE